MKKLPVRLIAILWALLALAAVGQALTERQRAPAAAISAAVEVAPPIGKDSVKFLVIGDSGTGDRAQTETGAQMWKAHAIFPYEFAIMLGFAEGGRATVGVIDCCALGEVFAAAEGVGAFRIADGSRTQIHVSNVTSLSEASCTVSRSNRSEAVEQRIALLGCKTLVPTGGSGIKAVRLATGRVDLYAHPAKGPIKLWDTCAPEAIVRAAGGLYSDWHGVEFDYRGPYEQNAGTLAANSALHGAALKALNPT